MEAFRIGTVHISAATPESAQELIGRRAREGQGGYVCVSNVRMVKYAGRHPRYSALMDGAIMNLPDGMPLTWCGKLWGVKGVRRTCGPELFDRMLGSDEPGLWHFLLGDTPDILDRIVEKYNRDGKEVIAGTYSLPFAEVDDFDYDHIAGMVEKSGANVVWTAMRAPKQDEFNSRLFSLLPRVVSIGVGRAFRASVGEFREVPALARKLGLSGFWLLRGSFLEELSFYVKASFFLLKSMLEIVWWRICGKQAGE